MARIRSISSVSIVAALVAACGGKILASGRVFEDTTSVDDASSTSPSSEPTHASASVTDAAVGDAITDAGTAYPSDGSCPGPLDPYWDQVLGKDAGIPICGLYLQGSFQRPAQVSAALFCALLARSPNPSLSRICESSVCDNYSSGIYCSLRGEVVFNDAGGYCELAPDAASAPTVECGFFSPH